MQKLHVKKSQKLRARKIRVARKLRAKKNARRLAARKAKIEFLNS